MPESDMTLITSISCHYHVEYSSPTDELSQVAHYIIITLGHFHDAKPFTSNFVHGCTEYTKTHTVCKEYRLLDCSPV